MLRLSSLLLFSLLAAALVAQDTTIFPRGERAENVHHQGDVWLYHPGESDEAFDYGLAVATFAPDARLDWHSHPAGQRLIITAGTGYYQERGKEVLTVRKGDVINCLPGIEHWHAATPDSSVTYLALTGDEPTQWLEPVADAVYYAAGDSNGAASVAQELLNLSERKWQWMAEQNADKLADLFHDQAMFVHMGGSWDKNREVEIIRSGAIHYKRADVHEASVRVIDNTAIVLSNITLLAVVGGNEVTNPFEVTEVYTNVQGDWKLASLSFTRLMTQD